MEKAAPRQFYERLCPTCESPQARCAYLESLEQRWYLTSREECACLLTLARSLSVGLEQ